MARGRHIHLSDNTEWLALASSMFVPRLGFGMGPILGYYLVAGVISRERPLAD